MPVEADLRRWRRRAGGNGAAMGGSDEGERRSVLAPVEEDPNAATVYSSPPCFMHELDPTYLGYLGPAEVAAMLGGLLAADWCGAVPDEERFRGALRRHLDAYNGSTVTAGTVCRGPDGLDRALQEALPRVHDDALRRDLEDLLGALRRGSAPFGGA